MLKNNFLDIYKNSESKNSVQNTEVLVGVQYFDKNFHGRTVFLNS